MRAVAVATLEKLRRVRAYDVAHPAETRERKRRYETTAAGRKSKRKYYTSAKGRKANAANKRIQRERVTWQTLVYSVGRGSSAPRVMRLLRNSLTPSALTSLSSAMLHGTL